MSQDRPDAAEEQKPRKRGRPPKQVAVDVQETAASAQKSETAPANRKSAKKKVSKKKSKKKASAPTKKMLAEAELERMNTTPMSQCAALEGLPPMRFAAGPCASASRSRSWASPDSSQMTHAAGSRGPHLRVSLGYLCEIFGYLRKHGIHMYRMSSDLAPYATHPTMPQFHNMVRESRRRPRARRPARPRAGSPPQLSSLAVHRPQQRKRRAHAQKHVGPRSQAEMLDLMECGPEAVLVVHVGGAYGDRESGWRRWVATWPRLCEPVRRRLVLENDDIRYSAADVLKVHEATGVKCVWDYQHHWCFNPEGLEMGSTLRRFLATWPSGVRPKMHFSCARTEMREIKRKNRKTGKPELVLQPPVWTGHADYNNPFESIQFLRSIIDVDVDVMLESKAKDLSLIRLRNDIARYAPDLAARYGIDLATEVEDVGEVVEDEDTEDETADLAE